MLRGNGSARAETSVNATARPDTMRITIRCGPLRDTLDDDLSTIIISPFVTYIRLHWPAGFSPSTVQRPYHDALSGWTGTVK